MPDLSRELTDIERGLALLGRGWDTPLAAHLAYLALNLKCQAERDGEDELVAAAQALAHSLHDAVREARQTGHPPADLTQALAARLARLKASRKLASPPPGLPVVHGGILLLAGPGDDVAALEQSLARYGVTLSVHPDPDALIAALDTFQPAALALVRTDSRHDAAMSALARTRLAHIPFVVLSPESDFASRIAAVRLGASVFLPWPVGHDELLTALAVPLADSQPLRVLVIDPQVDLVHWYADALTAAGLEVLLASSGAEGYDSMLRNHPDVLLVNRILPDCDGLDFARVVRQTCPVPPMPVLMLASEALQPQRRLSDESIEYWLARPVATDELLVAVQRAGRRRRLQLGLSQRDALTGALTVQALCERLDEELSRVARSAQPLVLALVDLNGFSSFNRRQGYAAGDRVLATWARFLRKRLRRNDLIGRVDGDAFVLVLPDTGLEAAQALLDSLSLAFSELALGDGDAAERLSFSMRLCEADPRLPAAEQLTALEADA